MKTDEKKESINNFLKEDDILLMTESDVNTSYDYFYKKTLKEAVYPHLSTNNK